MAFIRLAQLYQNLEKIGFSIATLSLCLAAASAYGGSCKIPDTGPPGSSGIPGTPGADGSQGPVGPVGPVGPFIKRTAAAHSDVAQTISVSGTPISFEVNNFVPIGIVHPTLGGPAEFAVLNSGTYFITFTFTAVSDTTGNVVEATLVNLTTGLPISPFPIALQTVDNQRMVVSAQTQTFLNAGDRVELFITLGIGDPVTITDPTFTITQIGP